MKDKEVPKIKKEDLCYFEHDFRDNCRIEKVFNIDLKSAYATILFNDGFISSETFSYLSNLPKHDRLASVGMLASKKKDFGFDKKGRVISYEHTISPLENFFYYAVERTFEIMQNLKSILRDVYLFTWVDGIYFVPHMERLVQCEDYLRRIGFRYSEEILSDWNVRVVSGAVKVRFVKEGVMKSFSLPARESEFALLMAQAMVDQNSKLSKTKTRI